MLWSGLLYASYLFYGELVKLAINPKGEVIGNVKTKIPLAHFGNIKYNET